MRRTPSWRMGVGMLRLLEVELNGAALGAPQNIPVAPFSIATGVAAAPFCGKSLTGRPQNVILN